MLLLCAGLSLPVGAIVAAPDTNYVPMKIIQTDSVIFPRAAKDLGIVDGEVRVAVQVDEKGKLTDYLVTAYTFPAFAETTVNALKRWSYEPAYLYGEARSATVDLTFTFESKGMVVVDLTVGSYVELRNFQMHPNSYGFHACTLRDLDRIPTPQKVVQPIYPVEAAKQRRAPATITVNFYIDDQGHVRMPAVSRETGELSDSLSAAAVQAVSQWQFEPPMSKGHAVIVAAKQDFNFKPSP